jgi:hypothetical protein
MTVYARPRSIARALPYRHTRHRKRARPLAATAPSNRRFPAPLFTRHGARPVRVVLAGSAKTPQTRGQFLHWTGIRSPLWHAASCVYPGRLVGRERARVYGHRQWRTSRMDDGRYSWNIANGMYVVHFKTAMESYMSASRFSLRLSIHSRPVAPCSQPQLFVAASLASPTPMPVGGTHAPSQRSKVRCYTPWITHRPLRFCPRSKSGLVLGRSDSAR